MFALHFDVCAPQSGGAPAELYAAAIEMCAWSETRGCATVVVAEHDASPGLNRPGLLIFATSIAAHTYSVAIEVAGVLPPFGPPTYLVEQMSVLDTLSKGRVTYVEPEMSDSPAVFVADDVDDAWDEIGMNVRDDARIISVAEATSHVAQGGVLRLAPLLGGIEPGIAWLYLERAAKVAAAPASDDRLATITGPEPLPWGFCAGAAAHLT